MPPETPKRSADKSMSLTPSFTFGLGNSPSFRFTSPRGLNILSSLSPHRFFAKGSKPGSAPDSKEESAMETKDTVETDTTFESARTSESVEMWSLADDSQSLSMNLTSINEESDKDVYFSPNEFLLGSLFDDADESAVSQSAPKKRKLSPVNESPCGKLASSIEDLKSPERNSSIDSPQDSPNKNKVWTARLDEELLRCHAKYSAYKASHGGDPAIFKYTSQNKILSRMLLNKTGFLRSAKQISTRLSKLVKSAIPEIHVTSDSQLTPGPSRETEAMISAIASSPHESYETLPPAHLRKMNLSFQYTDSIQGAHIFTTFHTENTMKPQANSLSELKARLPNKNSIFLRDLDDISGDLLASKTGICNVSCDVNFNSEYHAASSPMSPMTDPRQFTMANGNFSSFLLVRVPSDKQPDSCKSLILSTIIYKGSDKVLHRSKEMVNGFGNQSHLDVEVPFMNKFWSGYLSFLSNGTQDYKDLENIIISQTIHERDQENAPLIFLVFTFSPAKTQHGSAKVSLHLLQGDDDKVDETDELETMVVSSPALESSPFENSPAKKRFQVNTNFNNGTYSQGPSSAPIYNSNLLQSFSKGDYASGMQVKPPMHHSKSTTFLSSESFSSSRPPHNPIMQSSMVRHNSAGQVPTYANLNGSRPQGNHFGIPGKVPVQQAPVTGSMIKAPPMAYFHHPQPPQFVTANNATLRQNWVPLPEQHPIVHSAPSSQLGFTTRYSTPPAENMTEIKPAGSYKQKTGVKFGPIISYDPSQNGDSVAPSQAPDIIGSGYHHRFTVPPREIFQPHKME